MAQLTNFSFEFFYEIFTEDASLLFLYHGAKKSNDQKLKSRGGGGSCLNTPTLVEVEKIKAQLMEEFADVFNDTPLRPMKGPPMEIELKAEAVPFRVHGPRVMPYAYRDQVKGQIEDMVAQGIIEPVSEASDWCHSIVVVDKKGTTEKRLAVDFKKLNDQVRRPTHPTRSPRDVVSKISNAKYFTKMDA